VTAFRITFDTASRNCPCGALLQFVFGEEDSEGRCEQCQREGEWDDELPMVIALDTIASEIAIADDRTARMILADAERVIDEIGVALVPEGSGRYQTDRQFLRELMHRLTPANLGGERLLELVALLVPNTTKDDLQAGVDALRIHQAALETEGTVAETAMLLLPLAPDTATVGEAVDLLGIDFERFTNVIAVLAAQLGVAVSDLPTNVVAGAIADSKVAGQ
jgi:hypothetical protein